MPKSSLTIIVKSPWRPVRIAYQAALIGPLLYAPRTEMGRKFPDRVAQFAPNTYQEAMQQVLACHKRGATSVHIHPIEKDTGRHKKDPAIYAKNAHGARLRVPGMIVNNDASLNSVALNKDCTEGEYLTTRLAGLINRSPPDVFTLFATNEALLVAATSGGFPRPYVESFIRTAGAFIAGRDITALAEISQDPYGLRSVHRGLEILTQSGIKLPGLSFSFLVNGTATFPAFSEKPLPYTDPKGKAHKETPKARFMRMVEEGVRIKDKYKLSGPLTFGTVVRARDGGRPGQRTLQREVWDWVCEFVKARPDAAHKYGIIIKTGLEEWSSFDGEQVTNPASVTLARDHLEAQKQGRDILFEPVTDISVVRSWLTPAQKTSAHQRRFG